MKKVGADWTQITVPNYPTSTSKWDFVNSGDFDLKNFVGSKIQVAFKYVGTTSVAPTYELKNVLIK